MKSDEYVGSFLDAVRQPVLYGFGLDKPAGFETNINSRIVFNKRTIKTVNSEITFHLEADDGRRLEFTGETITSAHS